jgi:hypothetical protein
MLPAKGTDGQLPAQTPGSYVSFVYPLSTEGVMVRVSPLTKMRSRAPQAGASAMGFGVHGGGVGTTKTSEELIWRFIQREGTFEGLTLSWSVGFYPNLV